MHRLHFLAIGAISVLLAACTVSSQDILEDVTEGETTSSSSSSENASVAIGERPFHDGLEIGRENAPLTMGLFINYDSPYSRQFHVHMPLLQAEFVEKGSMKLQIYPVSLQKYPESTRKASMLRCAAAQGKGLAMHGLLITGSETLLPSGIDRNAFETCMTLPAPTSTTALEQDVTLVPTYFIDGERFTGVPTEADLRGSIRSKL